MARRPHPHISIPPGAAPPAPPSPSRPASDWDFLVTPADRDPLNLWNDEHRNSSYTPASPETSRSQLAFPDFPARPASRAASFYEAGSPRYAFPEPQLSRTPTRTSLRPSASHQHLGHRSTQSESFLVARPNVNRGESRPPSYVSTASSPELPAKDLTDELSNLTLESEEGLRRFQAGELNENDEEWHRLVPPEARVVLDKNEVKRQSVLFEFIKSERDYVRDLELVQEVFIDPLLNTTPVPQQRLKGFIAEVFYNLDEILVYHRRMLDSLFARQRDQHPLIQSVADIVLDTSLVFRTPYEVYIKHYPLSEAHHRKELRRNTKYQSFLSQCSQDPRVRKRDLITFLSRPVTRLPRLSLLLETAYKCTAPDHPDQESLPLILSILSEFIKSTQPGIEAAEGKVKFWALCESLSYQKGEIIDLDLYDESRTLLHAGPLARRYRAEVGYNWADLHVALLDNYLLLLTRENRASGGIRHNVVSRPIPLEYLRLEVFDAPPENRKERAHSGLEQPRLFDSFRSRYRSVFPFTVYHASGESRRKYTLYTSTEAERGTWRKALVDAMVVRRIRQDGNMWFAPHTMNEEYFKESLGGSLPSGARMTGRISCAVPIASAGRNLIAIGCPSGIYVAVRGGPDFRRVLKKSNTTTLYALPESNKVLVHSDDGLDSYSLDILAGVKLGTSRPQDLDASREQVSGQDVAVLFVRVGRIGGRAMVLYATKSFMQVTLHALEVVNAGDYSSQRNSGTIPQSFRPFGEPVWIPKDSHDITALHRNVGICTERGIHIVDPTNLSASNCNVTVVPAFNDSSQPMQDLKRRCSDTKPLGLVRVASNELLMIFDELGCYIDKHGLPCRSSGYLRWESKATSVAHRGEHILLFSPGFIEIRSVMTGRLVQVIEGENIRLVHTSERAIFVAMKGVQDKGAGWVTDKLVELVETSDLVAQQRTTQTNNAQGLWDEWDM